MTYLLEDSHGKLWWNIAFGDEFVEGVGQGCTDT